MSALDRTVFVLALGLASLVFAAACTEADDDDAGDDDDAVVTDDDTADDDDAVVTDDDSTDDDSTDDDSEGDDDTDPERPPLDPARGIEDLGTHTDGTECPEHAPPIVPSGATVEAGAVTSYTFTGTVTGAIGNGVIYVRGRNLEEIVAEIPMTGDSYAVTMPVFCGENRVKQVWSNATCTSVIVTSVVTTDCVDAEIRITLVWDGLGTDWELHLVKPGGQINDNATDCTWTSCVRTTPDWGVAGDATDDPHKDVDWLGSYGPENIWLDKPEDGTYTVLVEHWSSAGAPSSDGRVIVNLHGKLAVIDITDLAPWHVWTAATITWPDAEVTLYQDIHDCTGNWASGCRDPLP